MTNSSASGRVRATSRSAATTPNATEAWVAPEQFRWRQSKLLGGTSRELRRTDGERDPGIEERTLRRLDIPFIPMKNRHVVD
jgi:hypothetical protein